MAVSGTGFNAGTLYAYLTLDNKEFNKNMLSSHIKAQEFEKKIRGIGIVMTAAGAAITAVMFKAVNSFRETGDMIDELARKTGISTEKLSGLGYAASLSGVSLEGISTAVKILSGNMLDAANGNEAAAKKFEALGISVKGADGTLKSADIIIGEVANKFKAMPDGIEKTALATDIFGRSGQSLIPVLNGGKDSIEALTARAKELGIVYSEQDAKAAAALDDAQISLKASFSGLSKEIGGALAPTLTGLEKTITGVVIGVKDWVKDNREISGTLTLVISGIAGLATAIGPILIALPFLKSGLEAVHLTLGKVAKAAGTAVLGLGAFFLGWEAGTLIRQIAGVDQAIQNLFQVTHITVAEFEKASMIKMGWTEQGKTALFLRDSLVEVAKKLDPTVQGLRGAILVIQGNEAAYNSLHPRLQRIVDGFSDLKGRTREAADALSEAPGKTQENIEAIEGIVEASTARIKELTLSETDFKIWQLDREFQKNVEVLTANRASKEEFLILERQHTLDLQKIREDAYIARKEKEKKQKEEEEKEAEILLEEKIKEFQKDEERWATHQEVIEGYRKEQQDLMFVEMAEREGWRAAELAKVAQWELDQKTLLYNRLQEQKITFQQYQNELNALKQTGSDKREAIENEARKRQEEADKERTRKYMENLATSINQAANIYQSYVTGVTNLFKALFDLKEARLNSWYDLEKQRILDSNMTNEERTAALENLDAQMHQKKAALEAQAAKREKAMAIAQAIANTAVAITTALKALPWPFNLPLIAFAIATGAAQIAAIGGAYKGPGIGDFGGGGNDGGGGGGGGGGNGGGGGPGKHEVPAFQSGTGGYIVPPRDFLVGEEGPELVHMRGTTGRALMAITPLSQSREPGGNINISIPIAVTAVDASHFKAKIQAEIIPAIKEAILAGLIMIPRSRIR